MIASIASIILTGLIFGLLVSPAGADDPPMLNMGPTCDAAAAGAITLGRDKQACMQEEEGARDSRRGIGQTIPPPTGRGASA
jgi:hypothetical protein